MYERIVTVTGNGVKEQKSISQNRDKHRRCYCQCGGFNGTPGKIIAGGPMTGITQFSLDTPIAKGVTGIIVLTEEEVKPVKVSPCIKCGKCVEACPVHLLPLTISAYSLQDKYDEAEEYNALACIECGSCSYVCPAKRPLTESIAHAKREIKSKRKKS